MSTKHSSSTNTALTNEERARELLSDLKSLKYKNVVFMVGAGISTAAGIPDFRSPKTGLYANLQKFKLPYPEAVFDIDYLRKNPKPFFLLAQEMYPSKFQPTVFHKFMKWSCDLGVVKRIYTQNIDTLERRAGISDELIVEAHGSFNGQHCIDCHFEADSAETESRIMEKQVPKCSQCSGIVKPNIVFFGEGLPQRFFDKLESDFDDDVDLVVVAGTSLNVGPFNQLPDMPNRKVPRYLMNMEQVGSLGRRKHDQLILGDLERLDKVLLEFIDSRENEYTEASNGPKPANSKKDTRTTNDSSSDDTETATETGNRSKDKEYKEPDKPHETNLSGLQQETASEMKNESMDDIHKVGKMFKGLNLRNH